MSAKRAALGLFLVAWPFMLTIGVLIVAIAMTGGIFLLAAFIAVLIVVSMVFGFRLLE